MDLVNAVLTVIGLLMIFLGVDALRNGRARGSRIIDPAEIRKLGVYYLLFSGFFLLQSIGYAGVRLELFPEGVRGVLFLLGFALGVFALLRYRPSMLGHWSRRRD